jgi:hypothetical protein
VKAHASDHRLIIRGEALTAAEEAAESRIPRETGGILIGFRSCKDIYVVDIVEVPDDRSTGSRFVLKENSRETVLARYLNEVPPACPFGYVGSWHSHPATAHASGRDLRTLYHEAKTADDFVAMIILMRTPAGIWEAEGAVGHRERAVTRQSGRLRPWRPRISKVDLIVRPLDQPTPTGYGIPDGAGNDGST